MKSKAQRRKFAELLVKGEISEEVYERWNKETGRKDLPERVTPKGKGARENAVKKATQARKPTTQARKKTTKPKTATKKR